MSATNYPRPGFRIAPKSLREALDAGPPNPVIKKLCGEDLKFSELDETTWTRFGDQVSRQMAGIVLRLARRSLPREVLNRQLPAVHEGLELENLELEPRTRKCIRRIIRNGIAKHPSDLKNMTIGQ